MWHLSRAVCPQRRFAESQAPRAGLRPSLLHGLSVSDAERGGADQKHRLSRVQGAYPDQAKRGQTSGQQGDPRCDSIF